MTSAARKSTRFAARGFTLVELLIVIAIISILVAMILPAIQASRENSRATACGGNLRQIGLALAAHHQARQALPKGGWGNGTFGMSWWVPVLPFLEEEALYDQLDRKGAYCGSTVLHSANGAAVHNKSLSFMVCPSSSLPRFWPTGNVQVQMPAYVGIAGATSHDGFPETRVNKCCLPPNDSEISGGGALVPNRAILLREVLDGLSNTIVVGECSDSIDTKSGVLQRIDGGFNLGWLMGTIIDGTPPKYLPEIGYKTYNLTTIRYAPNMRTYEMPGIYTAHGANNPLVSPHPGGVHVLALDASVRTLSNNTDVRVLKSLATRDDGGTIELRN